MSGRSAFAQRSYGGTGLVGHKGPIRLAADVNQLLKRLSVRTWLGVEFAFGHFKAFDMPEGHDSY